MRLKIVLVRPVYPENIGLVARAMANFGFGEMTLVRPECDFRGDKARSRAMHGKGVLLKARSFESLGQALKGCSYAVGTSAKARRGRPFLELPAFSRRFSGSRERVALVFGPEPHGLNASEVGECDFLVRVPTSPKYPTLNLSHAACIALFSLFSEARKKPEGFAEAGPSTKEKLVELFERNLEGVGGIRDRAMVRASFRALVSRSLLSEKEAKALTTFFGKAGKRTTAKKRGKAGLKRQ